MSCGGDEAHHCLTLVWDAGKFCCRKNGRLPNSGAFSPRVVRGVF